jgi:NADH-quinone oxidoreductase subunit J
MVCLNIVNIVLGMGVEYFGVIILLVYVGAIAVLFLFVVMLINVRFVERLDMKLSYMPLAFGIGVIMLVELATLVIGSGVGVMNYVGDVEWVKYIVCLSNIEMNGLGLYLLYCDGVVLGSYILLIGIVGSLGITGRSREKILVRERLRGINTY